MTSQPNYQAIVMHTLPNILRRKSNQTVKPGQLLEYNIRHIFLEKSNYSQIVFYKIETQHISGSVV